MSSTSRRSKLGQLAVARPPAVATTAVDTALSLVRPQAVAKGIGLATACEGDRSAPYLGDQARVQQILVNLLSNAVKSTPSQGRVSVRCGTTDNAPARAPNGGGWTYFTVEDTGIGIPEDKIGSIFQPFTQVESGYSRSHGGTGRGLTISRRLARLMGGDLTVESREGEGSRFTLWLPAPANSELRGRPLGGHSPPQAGGSSYDLTSSVRR